MKLLFNATTNVMGGPVQNAVNFVLASLEDDQDQVEWSYAVSRPIADQLAHLAIGDRLSVFEASPARNISERSRLRCLAHSGRFAAVYTMAGPAYVDFDCLHIQGCSNPYLTGVTWQTLRYGRSHAESVATWIKNRYQFGHMLRADRWIFQTEASRRGFIRRSKVPEPQTAVVANALGFSFVNSPQSDASNFADRAAGRTILVPSADYPHKAIPFVADTVLELRRRMAADSFSFVLTIPETSRSIQRMRSREDWDKVAPCIIVRGNYVHAEAPALFAQADAVFLPSILEVFSTSYVEAIAMGKPLVVPELSFTREICREFAVYFQPLDASDAANCLHEVLCSSRAAAPTAGNLEWIRSRYPDYRGRYRRLKSQIMSWVA